MTDPVCLPEMLRAVVFDVDGTLYDDRRLRARVMWELATSILREPRKKIETVFCLLAYRRAQEYLRRQGVEGDLALAQLQLASRISGRPIELVREYVRTWMDLRPLTLLASCAHDGLLEFLNCLQQHQVALAVFSDYPAIDKLRAMQLDGYFQAVVSAQDDDVRALKPSPIGISVALHRLGVDANHALFVGDRPDVDGAAAALAGVAYANIGRHSAHFFGRIGYPELHKQCLAKFGK